MANGDVVADIVDRVRALLALGWSRPRLSKELKVSYHTIRVACDALGIPSHSSGRPPRDESNALINLLDQCRFYATKAGLFFRTARSTHYFYDQPIATFTDVHAALAFVKNRTRREATRQLHRLNGHASAVPHSLGAAAVIDRWHNQPPTIVRRIELGRGWRSVSRSRQCEMADKVLVEMTPV